MKKPRHPGSAPVHPGDGAGTWRPSLGYLAIAVGVAVGGLTYWLMAPPNSTESAGAPPAPASVPAPEAPPPSRPTTGKQEMPPSPLPARAEVVPMDGNDPTPDLSAYVNPGEKPTMNEVIERLHQAGVHTGLGAFSPPGTRPPLVGIAVPENFVLPPGYVRHHQATDDGQRIEAVLMFAPDHQLFDANNQPIAMPKDRVVPPELAPPGLAIRRVEVPAPIESARGGL